MEKAVQIVAFMLLVSEFLSDDAISNSEYCSSDTCDMAHRVIFAGATGETGRLVLEHLLKDTRVSKVTTLGRRESTVTNEKLVHKVVDFENLSDDDFAEHDVAISCLGTTRGKSGEEGFLKVDRDYILSFAGKSKAAGVKQFHLQSSQGANKDSYFLYTQVKGQVDEQVLGMEFERTVVYRPAVLLVKREESRFGEKIAQAVASWTDTSRSWSIKIADVAVAMASNIFDGTSGGSIMDNTAIIAKAKEVSSTTGEQSTVQ